MDQPRDPRRSFSRSSNRDAPGDTIIVSPTPSSFQSAEQGQLPQEQSQPQTQTRQQRRVCNTCRRRKVGCDKKQPCQNCKRSNTECVYPPDRASSTVSLESSQIWEQLRRLEPLIKTLTDRVPPETVSTSSAASAPAALALSLASPSAIIAPSTTPNVDRIPTISEPPQRAATENEAGKAPAFHETQQRFPVTGSETPGFIHQHNSDDTTMLSGRASLDLTSGISPLNSDSPSSSVATTWSPYGSNTGILVKDDGRRRYVSGRFWETLHDTDHVQDQLSDGSDYEDDPPSPPPDSSFQYSLIFGSTISSSPLMNAHLPEPKRVLAWQIFKENVHPLMTVLHVPTVEPVVLKAAQDIGNISPSVETLMFIVYFAAVASVSEDSCRQLFGDTQQKLLQSLRRSAEESFSRAGLMETEDIVLLQSFVIFIAVLRSQDPARSWNLTGLALRLVQSLGMHRDGSQFQLSIFEAEMRRRIWWGLCGLDVPASEDHSCASGILELSSSDARPPLNVDDNELYPEMTDYPTESGGMSDVCFFVIRALVTDIWRTMYDTRRTDPDTGKSFASMTIAEKERWVDQQHKKIRLRFFGSGQVVEPLHIFSAHYVEAIFCNLRLFVYEALRSDGALVQEQRRLLFNDALDCMTHSHCMRADARYNKWTWLSNTFNEWYSVAVVLTELSDRPFAKNREKAWRLVEQFTLYRWESPRHRHVHQWRSVMKGIEKARRRRKQVKRMQAGSASQFGLISTRTANTLSRQPPLAKLPEATERFPREETSGKSQQSSNMNADGHSMDFSHQPGARSPDATDLDLPFDFGLVDSQLAFDWNIFNTPRMDDSTS
ncbi:hypothetical protein G7Z17_g3893 [Cylindrodendrum hubeiense]|uniref:Zn(2)-C6 fungal-type domain-containing protein n=1 Tax=Cylindrodendrum hubeiense TaxID=595255 RepID=A0A9P5H9U6_9HYPO|nr:hypothetical protein G7Z17_g3893 [Cylindrodendrum hubeiense]